MNRRELICSRILAVLNDEDAVLHEATLHALVEPRVGGGRLLVSEFSEALGICERAGFVSGLRSSTKGVRWHITDAGRAELNR